MMTRDNSKFQTGSGTYNCRCCGKLTRETGYGESDSDMCAVCFEAGGFENSLSDGGHPNPWGIFDDCKTLAEVHAKYDAECQKHDI